jgi:hypothetical protein
MNVKFDKLNRVEGQKGDGSTWVAYKITGERLDGKGRWESSNIFDNKYNSKLLEQARELEQGDKIKVSHEKNAQGYWTITGIRDLTEEEQETLKNPTYGKTGSSGSTGGTGRSTTWNGRTGDAYDRSAAIYLSFDIIKSSVPSKELQKLTPTEVFATCVELSTMINDYIHEGKVVAVLAKDDDDGLTPPNI